MEWQRISRPEVFIEKIILKRFAKFKGKHLSLGPFLITLHAEGLKHF